MTKRKEKKIGFYRKTKNSNKELVVLFEEIQKIRSESNDENWENKDFVKKLVGLERTASKKILRFLKNKKLKTSDDFYRTSFIFHHRPGFRSFAMAVTLAAISNHLGEPWGKNLYAVALDRLLLSLGLPQHFGSQFIKRHGKWQLAEIDSKTTDKERQEYLIEPLLVLKKRAKEMNKVIVGESSSRG